MEALACVAGIGLALLFVGAIIGLGWVVIGPLGGIARTRFTGPRFQLLDLFWLVLLLQPSLIIFGALVRDGQGSHPQWIMIYVLIWGGIAVAWYGMTSALSQAGVTSAAKRAVAVLVILPMFGAVNPAAVLAQFAIVSIIANQYTNVSLLSAFAFVGGEIAYIVALFICRQLSRWIASGVDVGGKQEKELSAEDAQRS